MSTNDFIYKAFGKGANLYTKVLGISCSDSDLSSLTGSHLRRAYYRQALLYHPDKQHSSETTDINLEEATCKFQAVSLAYRILSDPISRKIYDDSGEILDSDSVFLKTVSWKEYFSSIFGKISNDDIDSFTLRYKCSDEEKADVLKYYIEFKGNLHKILKCVMCSSDVDINRWMQDYIEPAIQSGILPNYPQKNKQLSKKSKSGNKPKKITKKKCNYKTKARKGITTDNKLNLYIAEKTT